MGTGALQAVSSLLRCVARSGMADCTTIEIRAVCGQTNPVHSSAF